MREAVEEVFVPALRELSRHEAGRELKLARDVALNRTKTEKARPAQAERASGFRKSANYAAGNPRNVRSAI